MLHRRSIFSATASRFTHLASQPHTHKQKAKLQNKKKLPKKGSTREEKNKNGFCPYFCGLNKAKLLSHIAISLPPVLLGVTRKNQAYLVTLRWQSRMSESVRLEVLSRVSQQLDADWPAACRSMYLYMYVCIWISSSLWLGMIFNLCFLVSYYHP